MKEEQKGASWILISLIVVLATTRLARHLLDVHLPDAAVPTFFMAACFGLRSRALVLLLLTAAGIDLVQFALGASLACVSPGYPLLFVAYAASWCGGVLARKRAIHFQLLAMVGSGLVAFVLTSGGYYLLSGKFPYPSLAEFVQRSQRFLPDYLMNMGLYAGVGLAAAGLWDRLRRRSRA